MKSYLRLLILSALICWLSVEACPASATQSYLVKNSVLKSQRSEYTLFLLAQQSKDSTTTEDTNSLKLKRPYMAVFYSFVPGVVIHGAGHIYAGKIPTGLLLFGSEVVGISFMVLGGVSGLDNGQASGGGDTAEFIGSALFVGSWVYDIFGSYQAVQKQNQKLLKGKNTELRFQPKDSGLRLVLVYHF
jgi:hypothetical protein